MLDNPDNAATIHFLRGRISLLEAEVDRLLIVVNSYADNTEKGKLAENYIGVRRTTRGGGRPLAKTNPAQVQRIDEGIDGARRMLRGDIILRRLGP